MTPLMQTALLLFDKVTKQCFFSLRLILFGNLYYFDVLAKLILSGFLKVELPPCASSARFNSSRNIKMTQPTSHLTTFLFDGGDFTGWKQEVLMALASKNKESFIADEDTKPAATDRKYRQWVRCDLMVMRWVLNSLDKSIRDNLKYVTSARQLWGELVERYGQANSIEIYQLKKTMGDIHQGNASLMEYYSKLKSTWENLEHLDPLPTCSCGKCNSCTCSLFKKIQERENNSKLIQFLMNLNGSYENIRTQILSLDPLPTINKALGMLQKIEKQKQVTETAEALHESTAYASYKPDGKQGAKKTENGGSKKYCSHCDMNNHNLEDCFRVQECAYCGKTGHKIEKCYRLVGFPADKGNKGKAKVPDARKGKNSNNTKKSTANNVENCEDDDILQDIVGDKVQTASRNRNVAADADSATIEGLVSSVLDQVLQRMAENKASTSSANFAGPGSSQFAGPFK